MLHMAQMMATETCLCESTNYFEKAQYEACKTALVNYLSDFEKIHLKISEDFEASYSDKTHNIGCICDVNKSDDIPVECTMCLKWSIQLNISVCSLMDLHLQKKKNCEEISVVCEKFQSLLQEMHVKKFDLYRFLKINKVFVMEANQTSLVQQVACMDDLSQILPPNKLNYKLPA